MSTWPLKGSIWTDSGIDLRPARPGAAWWALCGHPWGTPDAATAGDGSGIAAGRADASSADADLESTLDAIKARLKQLESAVTGQEYSARVVDAGDGTILLRLDDPAAGLKHGQEVNIRLQADDTLPEREP